MAIYTYAFLRIPDDPLELPSGIQTQTQMLHLPPLGAIYETDLEPEHLQANDEQLMRAVLAHDRVIQAVFSQSPVLPLRFGTCFVNRDRLLDHMAVQSTTYLQFLDDIANKAEYTLKAIPLELQAASDTTQATGRNYLLQKKKQYQAQTDYLNQQREQLDAVFEQVRSLYPSVGGDSLEIGVEKLNLLCDRQEEAILYERYQQWQTQCPYWTLQMSEALPPYHFTHLNRDD